MEQVWSLSIPFYVTVTVTLLPKSLFCWKLRLQLTNVVFSLFHFFITRYSLRVFGSYQHPCNLSGLLFFLQSSFPHVLSYLFHLHLFSFASFPHSLLSSPIALRFFSYWPTAISDLSHLIPHLMTSVTSVLTSMEWKRRHTWGIGYVYGSGLHLPSLWPTNSFTKLPK